MTLASATEIGAEKISVKPNTTRIADTIRIV
jgi:hypothetical protein